MSEFLAFMIPIVAAAIGSPIAEWLQKLVGFLDKLNPAIKRIGVAVLVYWINWGGIKLGVWTGQLDLQSIGAEQLSNLAASALAYLFHGQDAAKTERDSN